MILQMALKDSDQSLVSSVINVCGGCAASESTYSVNAEQQEYISLCSTIDNVRASAKEVVAESTTRTRSMPKMLLPRNGAPQLQT